MILNPKIKDLVFEVDTHQTYKFSLMEFPKVGKKSKRLLYISNEELENKIHDLPEDTAKTIVEGYPTKLKLPYPKLGLYLPGAFAVESAEYEYEDVYTILDKQMPAKIYVKAFIGVNDHYTIGIIYHSSFHKTFSMRAKMLSHHIDREIHELTGLPYPIPARQVQVYLTEERFVKIRDIYNRACEEKQKRKRSFNYIRPVVFKRELYQWFEEILREQVGFYDPEKYRVNFRAVQCSSQIVEYVNYILGYDTSCKAAFGPVLDRRYLGKMSVDLNRVLLKRNVDML